MKHPHAPLIAQYSKDSEASDEPWKFWMIRRDSYWYPCTATDMYFGKHREYKRI